VDYQSSFRVVPQQLEVLGLERRGNNTMPVLLHQDFTVHHVSPEGQDVPRKDRLAVRRVVAERRDLILREAELFGLDQIAQPSQPEPVHIYGTRHTKSAEWTRGGDGCPGGGGMGDCKDFFCTTGTVKSPKKQK